MFCHQDILAVHAGLAVKMLQSNDCDSVLVDKQFNSDLFIK